MINKNYSPPSSRHAYSKTYSVKCYKHIREGCSWWNSGVTHIMAVESAGKWGFQIRNKQKKKNDILKHDHVSVQACLVNKMQKSCGEGQSLSNTASAKLFQNTKFSRDIPEVSTALYSFFFFFKQVVKTGEKFNWHHSGISYWDKGRETQQLPVWMRRWLFSVSGTGAPVPLILGSW